MSKIIGTFDMSESKYLRGKHVLRHIGNYGDGTPALALFDQEGEEAAVVTVSLAGYGIVPPEGHVYIKNYSENEGVLKPLVYAGILEIVDIVQPQGSYVAFPLCEILVNLGTL